MEPVNFEQIEYKCQKILEDWLKSCTRNNKISRNTIAVGIVVFDHLIQKCPIHRSDVISQGGEISGARSGLGKILEKYDIPRNYLKEITTRQGHQDGQRLFEDFQWGTTFLVVQPEQREIILRKLIGILKTFVEEWFRRQNLKLIVDRTESPSTWINTIIENAKGHSGGVVEQHLVGAKLVKRFTRVTIPNFPAHAGDVQTERAGDFTIAHLVYHVTAAPSRNVLQKCNLNLKSRLHPILLVPRSQENKAMVLAQDEGIDREMTIISIEDFIAINIIELATEENKDFFRVLQEIIEIYNARLAEVETDLSLEIEVK